MNNEHELPLVSIIIPVYNGGKYLSEAIESALAQTYPNTEIIVVNDGSTDNGESEKIALSYGDRIRYFHKANGGVSSALNLGISQMQGEYFSWLSHDDVYEPLKIEVQMRQILGHTSSKAIVLCGGQYIDSNSHIISNKRLPSPFSNGLVPWNKALQYLLDKGWFNGCALLIPRSAFEESGLFHEGLRFAQDHLMWINILLSHYDLLFCDHCGIQSRIHSAQQTHLKQHLFSHDCAIIAELVAPRLLAVKTCNLLFHFTKRNAILGCKEAVTICQEQAKRTDLFSPFQTILLLLYSVYGRIRPSLRKVYYSVFLKMRTN